MKIITRTVENADQFSAALSDVLYLDIETTGLSAERASIYLIGCAGHEEGGWHMTQWLDQTGSEEKEVISSFLSYAAGFKTLIHYNGAHFDLPFLTKRADAFGLDASVLTRLASVDLYKVLSPWKDLLGLPNMKQQTVENCLGSGRTENESGKDLIPVYHDYIRLRRESDLSRLLAHNEADIRGLISLMPVLAFGQLPDSQLTVYRAQLNTCENASGETGEELLFYYRSTCALPQTVHASFEHCFMRQSGIEGILKIPVYKEEMKYFYPGYQDYYYLPAEDMAVHKSIASFVERSHKVQANARNCYTRKMSRFLPCMGYETSPVFFRSYDEKIPFFELTDPLKKDRARLSEYATAVFRSIILQN